MPIPRRAVLAFAVVGMALLLPAGAAVADARTLGTAEEAWYQACALPAGCESLPATSQYPAQTFHVALDAGAESARTYLQLDVSGLPADADLTGGTLVLPLADAADGTAAPETAEFVACLATEAVEHAEGAFAPPPEIDCGTSSPATYDASAGVMRVDLGPFVGQWSPGGVAAVGLVPADGAEGSWRVVVSGPDRDAAGAVPPTATLSFDVPDDEPAAVATPPPSSRPAAGATLLTDDIDDRPFAVAAPPAPSVGLPEAELPQVTIPPASFATRAPATSTGGPFRYTAVWLLPLALLAVGGLLGSVLTKPIRVAQRLS